MARKKTRGRKKKPEPSRKKTHRRKKPAAGTGSTGPRAR